MKRTLLSAIPEGIPEELLPYLTDAPLYDSSCSPEARVLYTPKDGGLYLKRAAKGALEKEARMSEYFHQKGLSVEPLAYLSRDEDFFLSRAGIGEDATDARYLADGRRLAICLGEWLRALHELPTDGCPVPDRTRDYIDAVKEGYACMRFDPSFAKNGRIGAEEAFRLALATAPRLTSRVLLHGDYCLPNILLYEWRLSAFIDLGAAGVGDRHIDLFWGAWTLRFNLGTDAFREDFLSAYGQDVIDRGILDAIGYCECFG